MSAPIKEPESFEGRAHKVSSTVYYVLASLGLIVPILTSQVGIPLTWILLIISGIVAVIVIYSTYDKKTSVVKYAKYIDAQVQIHKQDQEVESGKIFWDAQKSGIDASNAKGIERRSRENTYRNIIMAFEETAKDATRSEKDRAFYTEAVRRLKDMQDASRFD